jgi:hypothetical protein
MTTTSLPCPALIIEQSGHCTHRLYNDAAIMNCIWFNLWIVGSHGKLLNKHCSSSCITKRCSLLESLLHKGNCESATVTFHNSHCSSDNIGANESKQDRKRRIIPNSSMPTLLIKNESLNIGNMHHLVKNHAGTLDFNLDPLALELNAR